MVVSQTRARRRPAFTLVELLVVISIIGVLMALLLPAVNAARATMWKAECSNNIKQLTTAMTNWSSAKQMRLPGYAEPVGGKRMPWPVALMPYMEQQQLYDKFRSATLAQAIAMSDVDEPVDETIAILIPSFICAADGEKGSKPGAQMSYVANVGRYVANRSASITPQPAYKANGVFQNAEDKKVGPIVLMEPITLNLSGVTDGAAYTVAFSENLQAVTYGLPAAYNPNTLADEERFRLAAGFQWYANYPSAGLGINQPKPQFKTPGYPTVYTNQANARPSSFHAGGVNMGFVDGHVQFIPESIDYVTYMQLMTPNGAQSDMPTGTGNTPIPWQDIN